MKVFRTTLVISLLFGAFSGLLSEEKKSGGKKEWAPYTFKGTEEFHYKLSLKDSEGTREGSYIIKISPAEKDQFTLTIKGNLGENKFESTFTSDKESIYPTLMAQMMFNPAGAPLLVTLFAPWWGMYFVGKSWKVGNGWSFTDEDGKEVSFKVEDTCEYAGQKGYKTVMREDKEERFVACISPDIALPLYIRVHEEEGNLYTLELTEYKE